MRRDFSFYLIEILILVIRKVFSSFVSEMMERTVSEWRWGKFWVALDAF
jgi:hypothetical protein